MFRLNFQYSISQNWRRFLTEFSRLERCNLWCSWSIRRFRVPFCSIPQCRHRSFFPQRSIALRFGLQAVQPRLRFQFLQYIGAPQRSLILAHEVWRVLNRFSLFHAVASLFVRFRLGLLEWVFPCFSHTTIPNVQMCFPLGIPKVQKCVTLVLVDLEKYCKMSI